MFESIVASVLNSALGKFIDGLDADALSISVFKGEVELVDLNLKDSAFDGLGCARQRRRHPTVARSSGAPTAASTLLTLPLFVDLSRPRRVPVALVAGKVGHIKLYADWKNLSTKAIRIEIDRVLAIIKPVEKFEASNKSEFKRGMLAADEMKWKAAGSGAANAKEEKAQSLFVQKIIDNIQITLSNVHIRYEDGITAQTSAVPDPARCFALGLTIDRLSITSWTKEKDGTWSDRFVEEPMQMMTKRIQLGDSKGGFAVYCNSGPEPWTDGGGQPIPPTQFTDAMTKMIKAHKFTQRGPVDHVIRPIELAIVLLRDKSEGKGYGAMDGRPIEDGWRVISAKQKDAPETRVRGPFRDGKFRYEPLNDVTVDMEEVSIVLASQTVTKFATLGSWLSLVSRKQLYEAWKPSTRAGLQRGSSWEDTRDWWVFAKKCNDHANKLVSVKWAARTILSACEKRRVYLSLYIRKSAKSQGHEWAVPLTTAEQEELQSLEDEFDVSVTKTWRRLALKRMSEEARKHAASQPVKRGWFGSSKTSYKELTEQELQFLNSFDVDEGEKQLYPEDWIETKISLTLKNATLTLEKEERDLAVIDLAGINAYAEMRTDGGLSANLGLKSFIVSDRCSSGDNRSNFRHVIERDRLRQNEGQLLECIFEKKPLAHPGVDIRVQLTLQPLQIVFNPYFVEELIAYSKTAEDLALEASLTDGFQNSARARALQLKRQTEILKETALTVRTVLDLDVTLSAPTILVPADCSADETDCILINLGDLKVKSTKGTREHDVFVLGLHDMKVQMFTTDGTQQTAAPPINIVEPVNMDLELCNSIRPTDPSVPKLKLKGQLQPVRMAISDKLIKRLVALATTIQTKRERALVSVRGRMSTAVLKASPKPQSAPEPPELGLSKTNAVTRTPTINKRQKSSKSMRSLLQKAHSQHKEETKDELSQRLPFWEQLVAEFAVQEISVAISDESGELAVLKVQGLGVAATMRPYDKRVLLALKNLQIDDSHRAASLNVPCQLLSSGISGAQGASAAANLLDVEFWDTEPQSPEEWRVTRRVPADCVGRKLKANFGFLSLNLHLGTVSKLMNLSKVAGASETPMVETAPSLRDVAAEPVETAQVAGSSPPKATFEASFRAGGLCVELIPEITRSRPVTVATLQLQHVAADMTIDEIGVIDVAFKLSTIEVFRGPPARHHADGDYVVTVRERPSSANDEQLVTTAHVDDYASTLPERVNTATPDVNDQIHLLNVKAVLQPESKPEEASVVDVSFSGLNIQVAGPFVRSILQWVSDNPIGKEETVKAKEVAAKAQQEAAAKARQGAKAAKSMLMKIDVHLAAVTLSIPLIEHADQIQVEHCLQFELGGIDVKIRKEVQLVEFRETWATLKHGSREQQLLKPIGGMLQVADKPVPAGFATPNSRARSVRTITLTGLSTFESHISFRDVITLQAIAASMSAANISEPEVEDPVALAKATRQQRLAKMNGDSPLTGTATPSTTENDATALLAPATRPLQDDVDVVKSFSPEEAVEHQAEVTPIQVILPDEIKLVVKVLDDCTRITKPFLTAQVALEGLQIKSEGQSADVEGSLVLQLDGFDGTRGQLVPLLERFELEFIAHQGIHKNILDDPNAKPSLRLAVGSQAVRSDPQRPVHHGFLQVQPDGTGQFVAQEVEIHGENLRIGKANGKVVGLTWAELKTARAGQPHAFKIYLKEADSCAHKKYVLGAATAQEKSDWIAALCPTGARFELTVTDSYLRDALLTAGQFKELHERAHHTNFRDTTRYGDCVLSNELGVLLYYSRADESFESAHALEPGQTASVSTHVQPRVLPKAAGSPHRSLTRVDSASLEQTQSVVKLWFPEHFDPANTKMVEFEASFSQSSAVSFGAKTIELELNRKDTGGANVLTLRGTVTLQNCCDTTIEAKLQNGPPSSPRYTNTSPSIDLVVPAGGKLVGVPLTINTKSATIQFRGIGNDAEWSDSVPLAELIPYKTQCSESRSLLADHKWLCICGMAQPIRSYDHGAGHFHSVRREERVTVVVDPAIRFRNHIQQGIDLDYTIVDGGGGLGRVAELTHCHILGCETRPGSTFFEKDYVVYKFSLECADGTMHASEKRFSQFDEWYRTLDDRHVKLFMPPLPPKMESFFKSAEEIQRIRQTDLNTFVNDAIQAGARHPPVAQAVRSFMLSHLVVAKAKLQREEGKVRFGACETVALRNLSSLNSSIDLDVAVRVNGIDYKSDTSQSTTLLSGDGAEGKCATAITLFNRNGTRLRLNIDSVVRPTGAHEFLFNVDFCIVNRTGMSLLYHQAGDEQGLLGIQTEPSYPPEDVERWMFGAEIAHQHQTPFCFGHPESRTQLVICIKDGQAYQRTDPVALALGSKSVAEVPSTDRAKQFGVRVATAPGSASSKMVYLVPRFIACNHTGCEVDLAQVPHRYQHALQPMMIAQRVQKGSRAIHFPRHTQTPADRLLSIRMRHKGKLSAWSAGFGPQPAEFPLLIRDTENDQPMMIVRVTVAVHKDSTVLIHLQHQWSSEDSGASAASRYNYIVRNLSEEWAVGGRQKEQDKPEMTIAQYNSANPVDNEIPFAWDCAPSSLNPGLVSIRGENTSGQTFSLTCNIDELRVVRQSDPRVEVIADGSTKVLRFSDDVAKPIPWHLGSRLGLDLDPRPKLTCSNPECRHKIRASVADGLAFIQDPRYNVKCENCGCVMYVDKPPVATLRENKDAAEMRLEKAGRLIVELSFEGFGLSVVRSTTNKNLYRNPMEELLYISLSKLRVNVKKDMEKTQVQVKLHSLQIDNMMPDVAYPMVMYPEMEPGQDLLSLFLVRMENTTGLQHFKTFQMQVQPISINGELALVVRLMEFLAVVVARKDIMQAQDEARVAEQEAGALAVMPPAMGVGMMYFEDMVIGPMSFAVSWKGDGAKEVMQDMGIGAESGAVVASVVQMVGGLGAALTNLKKVPIKLQGLNLNHPFEPIHALTNRVVGHYTFELVYNSYKIFFGTEIFNPIGLLDGVGTGVVNLVTTPFTVQSPEEFAAGTVKNSLKLVQATVGGVFGLVGDTTGALSNVADTLGGGHRAADRTEKPHGVLDGLGHGALGVGRGLFNGVTGVFVKPVEGAMQRGALGFVEGVGQGVLGLGGNVVGGVVGGVSDVMSGIAEDIASIGAMVHRPVRRARWYATHARALVLCCLVSPMRHNDLLVLGLLHNSYGLSGPAGSLPAERWPPMMCRKPLGRRDWSTSSERAAGRANSWPRTRLTGTLSAARAMRFW